MAAEAAQRSQALSRAQETASLGSWECSLAAEEFRWSDQLLRMLEVPVSALKHSLDWIEPFLHPDEADGVLDRIGASLRKAEPCTLTHQLISARGSRMVVQQRIAFFNEPAGQLTHVSGTLQDVTALRAAQEAVERSERRFRALTESSMNAKALLD